MSNAYLFQSVAITPTDFMPRPFEKLHKSFRATQQVAPPATAGEHTRRLEAVAQKTDDVLLRVSAVFPFDFFPDEIIVDKNKISVIHKMFFAMSQVRSIPIEDIADVIVDKGPLFGQVRFINKQFIFEPLAVQYLKRRDAARVQEVVQGLVLARQEEIDFTRVTDSTLVSQAQLSGKIKSQPGNYMATV